MKLLAVLIPLLFPLVILLTPEHDHVWATYIFPFQTVWELLHHRATRLNAIPNDADYLSKVRAQLTSPTVSSTATSSPQGLWSYKPDKLMEHPFVKYMVTSILPNASTKGYKHYKVLDVACNKGYMLLGMQQLALVTKPNLTLDLSGLDISPTVVAEAAQYCPHCHLSTGNVIDRNSSPLLGQVYDLVFYSDVLYYLPFPAYLPPFILREFPATRDWAVVRAAQSELIEGGMSMCRTGGSLFVSNHQGNEVVADMMEYMGGRVEGIRRSKYGWVIPCRRNEN